MANVTKVTLNTLLKMDEITAAAHGVFVTDFLHLVRYAQERLINDGPYRGGITVDFNDQDYSVLPSSTINDEGQIELFGATPKDNHYRNLSEVITNISQRLQTHILTSVDAGLPKTGMKELAARLSYADQFLKHPDHATAAQDGIRTAILAGMGSITPPPPIENTRAGLTQLANVILQQRMEPRTAARGRSLLSPGGEKGVQ